jgi:hypothetical protein
MNYVWWIICGIKGGWGKDLSPHPLPFREGGEEGWVNRFRESAGFGLDFTHVEEAVIDDPFARLVFVQLKYVW